VYNKDTQKCISIFAALSLAPFKLVVIVIIIVV